MIIAILDLETTGVNFEEDKITELGFVLWDFEINQPTFMYSSFKDPEMPIGEIAGQVSGITDAMVKGKKLDVALIKRKMKEAKYIIAHNALFDMTFTIKELGEIDGVFAPARWLCSQMLIDWKRILPRSKSVALNYLAADMGIVNPFAHRALTDTLLLARMLTPEMIEEMIDKASCKWVRIEVRVKYNKRTIKELKLEGYRASYADGKFDCWCKDMPDDEKNITAQLHILEDRIYSKQTIIRYKGSKSDKSQPIDFGHPANVKYFDHWYNLATKLHKERNPDV